MPTVRDGKPADSQDASADQALRGAARSSILSFAGSMVSGLAGFGLSLILGRGLGPAGSGLVFQMVSVFTIASAIAKLGLDTTCVWLLPRLALTQRSDVRRAASILLVGSLAGGIVAGGVLALLAPFLDGGQADLVSLVRVAAIFIPLSSVSTVALAVTRGLGGIRPYVLIGSIGLPTLRLASAAIAVAFAASAVLVSMTWLATLALITALALLASARVLRPFTKPDASTRSRRDLTKQVGDYSLPRAMSSVIEQALLWQDVLIVGLIVGPEAAGVYGVVSRLVQAGFIPSTSMRIVVAPQFSRMLHRGQIDVLSDFYSRTAQWIVLMSVPMYVLFAVLGQPLLAIFGPGFIQGALTLTIASVGATIWSSAGNVQSLLLMSGHSGWAAINKLVVFAASLILLLTMVPRWGILGAATAWTLSMTLDAALALVQVRRSTGIKLGTKGILMAMICAGASVAIPATGARLVFGESPWALAIGIPLAIVAWAAITYLLRDKFALDHAVAVFARRNNN